MTSEWNGKRDLWLEMYQEAISWKLAKALVGFLADCCLKLYNASP